MLGADVAEVALHAIGCTTFMVLYMHVLPYTCALVAVLSVHIILCVPSHQTGAVAGDNAL